MKVALVCDDLIQHGGHERVIMDFCNLFPDAPLYAIAASKEWQKECKNKNIQLKTSFVQKLPFFEKLSRYYAPFFVHIFGIQSFDFTDYDLVISLSSRFAHGVITKPTTKHICYMSTVGRMFWEPFSYFKEESYGLLAPLKSLSSAVLLLPLHFIRLWDFVAAQRVDYFICNSKTTQDRIKKYYHKDSVIVNPAIDTKKFLNLPIENENFFLVITRLVSWKRVDIAIQACIAKNLKLKIIGTGPDLTRLKKLAGDSKNIEFLGFVSEDQKLEQLSKCTALINTQLEDFGIVPLEAQAAGKPVIAFGKGGVLETVIDGVTGEFFKDQTSQALEETLTTFDSSKYSDKSCRNQARKFDKSKFNFFLQEIIYNSEISST